MDPIELKSLNKKQGQWTLELSEWGAVFRRLGGETQVEIPRSVLREKCQMVPVFGGQGALIVTHNKTKLKFLLPPEQRESVDAAFGPETPGSLRLTLKRRYAFCAPIAILFVLSSLPLAADESTGLEAIPFSPLSCFLGIGLLGLWAHARFAPRPYLFVADSAWFVLLALSAVWDVLRGWASPLWLAWVVLLVYLAVQGVKLYKRFKFVRSEADISSG